MKPRKQSVALVIEGPSGLLLVRRPEDHVALVGAERRLQGAGVEGELAGPPPELPDAGQKRTV
jgi:hypothetical protein